jgi:CRP-like cAMP-binding protein
LEALRRVPELSRFSEARLRCLLMYFDEVVVPAGVAVAVEGRLCHEYIVVASGELEICRRGRATRFGPGESYGWRAMQDRSRHDATVVTMSPARLLVMGHAQFRAAEGLALSSVRSVSSSAA